MSLAGAPLAGVHNGVERTPIETLQDKPSFSTPPNHQGVAAQLVELSSSKNTSTKPLCETDCTNVPKNAPQARTLCLAESAGTNGVKLTATRSKRVNADKPAVAYFASFTDDVTSCRIKAEGEVAKYNAAVNRRHSVGNGTSKSKKKWVCSSISRDAKKRTASDCIYSQHVRRVVHGKCATKGIETRLLKLLKSGLESTPPAKMDWTAEDVREAIRLDKTATVWLVSQPTAHTCSGPPPRARGKRTCAFSSKLAACLIDGLISSDFNPAASMDQPRTAPGSPPGVFAEHAGRGNSTSARDGGHESAPSPTATSTSPSGALALPSPSLTPAPSLSGTSMEARTTGVLAQALHVMVNTNVHDRTHNMPARMSRRQASKVHGLLEQRKSASSSTSPVTNAAQGCKPTSGGSDVEEVHTCAASQASPPSLVSSQSNGSVLPSAVTHAHVRVPVAGLENSVPAENTSPCIACTVPTGRITAAPAGVNATAACTPPPMTETMAGTTGETQKNLDTVPRVSPAHSTEQTPVASEGQPVALTTVTAASDASPVRVSCGHGAKRKEIDETVLSNGSEERAFARMEASENTVVPTTLAEPVHGSDDEHSAKRARVLEGSTSLTN
eukprot:m.210356 g.210356  ORF g.210356 m.210356 type:complete len:614 (+) comp19006_c0_seq2:475-2316(+)